MRPGGTVHLHVSAPAGTRYRIEVYRLGWYGGVGARLLQCVPLDCVSDEAAVVQPTAPAPDPTTGYLDAGWSVTDVVTVGSNWVSGQYVAKLITTSGTGAGKMRMVPFVVHEASPQSPILVQIGVNTWQAYTNWGGKSLYTFNSTNGVAATEVSFNRPLNYINWPFQWDYQLIRFLERNGYNLSYATDVDTAQGIDALSAEAIGDRCRARRVLGQGDTRCVRRRPSLRNKHGLHGGQHGLHPDPICQRISVDL